MALKSMPTVLAITLVFIAAFGAAQSNPPAPKPQGAATNLGVRVEMNNPFTARRVTKTTNPSATDARRTPEILEIVARNIAGCVRIERQPGMRIAHVYEGRASQPHLRGEHPYSFFFTSSLRHNPTTDIFAEDLGHKMIEGIDALGIKTTQIGSEEDEWKGKSIRIFEKWVSDDLAATLVDTVIDLKKNTETTSSLTDVSRVEPDPSLFEIPTGYKINPTGDELPFRVGVAKPIGVQPKE